MLLFLQTTKRGEGKGKEIEKMKGRERRGESSAVYGDCILLGEGRVKCYYSSTKRDRERKRGEWGRR